MGLKQLFRNDLETEGLLCRDEKYQTPEIMHDAPLRDERDADFHFDDFAAAMAYNLPQCPAYSFLILVKT